MTTQVATNQPVNAKPVNGGVAEPTIAELKARIAELESASKTAMGYKCRAKGEAYKDNSGVDRVGKGGMSMMGFGSHPVTLYYNQWLRMIDECVSGRCKAAIDRFVAEGKLSTVKD